MKKVVGIVLAAALLACAGCSSVPKKTPLFLYAVGLDGDADTVTLTVLCCEGTSMGSTGSDGLEQSDPGGGHPLVRYHFTNETVRGTFGTLKERYGELYAGTVSLYVVSSALPEGRTEELAAYLLNTPDMPLKAGCCTAENADAFLKTAEMAYTDKTVSEAFDGRYGNVIAVLAAKTAA